MIRGPLAISDECSDRVCAFLGELLVRPVPTLRQGEQTRRRQSGRQRLPILDRKDDVVACAYMEHRRGG